MSPLVSVVIPVLREAELLGEALHGLSLSTKIEIIVVDGCMNDKPEAGMCALRKEFPGVRWVESIVGRARQMNAGAAVASGKWLLFLHADSRLHRNWIRELERIEHLNGVVGGSYRFVLNASERSARFIEWGVRQRVRWFGLAYGDQALFVKNEIFQALGGYRDLPVMEDIDLIRRLRRAGRLVHSSLPVLVSPRRWRRDGWWRRTVENIFLAALFYLGVSPHWLACRYYGTAAVSAYDRASSTKSFS